MNIWNMQLHPGKYGKSFTREVIKSILENYRLIGLGKSWGNDHGRPNAFVNKMKKGDIVVIRRNGPLAIVRVIGEPINLDRNDNPMWFGIARCVEILQIIDNPQEIINEFEQESKIDWKKGLMATTTLQIAWNWKFAQWWYNKVTNQSALTVTPFNTSNFSTSEKKEHSNGRWSKEIETLTSYFEGEMEDDLDFELSDYIYDIEQELEFASIPTKQSLEDLKEYNELKMLVKRAEQEIKNNYEATLDMMYPNRYDEDFDEDSDGYIDRDD